MKHVQLDDWTALAVEARGEGPYLTQGIVDPRLPDPKPSRRGVARASASIAADRRVWLSFDPGSSHADVRDGRVNIDAALVSPAENSVNFEFPFATSDPIDVANEVLAGVAAHEGAHQRYTAIHRERNPLLRFLVNLIEDERIERRLVIDMPVFAGPLAAARDKLITAEGVKGVFAALYLLIRAPGRLPTRMWRRHQTVLLGAISVLTPFPETHEQVCLAAEQIAALLPPGSEDVAPPFPEFGDGAPQGRRPRRGHFRRWGRGSDELSEPDPKVMWITAPAAPDGYAEYKAATTGLSRSVRAALNPPERTRYVPSARGSADRRRLWRHDFDDRVLRRAVSAKDVLDIVLILDLSGSMRGTRWESQHRLGVAFYEAVRLCSPYARLHVYGHGADAENRPSTQIYRLAESGKSGGGTATGLGDLPEGANNRDGHSLKLIGKDLLDNHPAPRRNRLVFHACDGSPSAAGYGGQPALGATRDALAWFRKNVAPIGQIGLEPEQDLALFGAPFVVWDESQATVLLRKLIRSMKG